LSQEQQDNTAELITITEVPKLLPRNFEAHKGNFGKICIIGGSVGMSGAPALAGRAALRSGAGLVRVAVPKSLLPIVAAIEPSYTTIPLDETNGKISKKTISEILDIANDNDVLAFGCGVGISIGLRQIIEELITIKDLRLIIDADGLNNLGKIKDWPKITKAKLTLTPHPGEMKRLYSRTFRDEMPMDRQDRAVELARKTQTTVVLKGAGTVVTDSQSIYVNTTGNPGMATAGSGDVLTGIITALMGQGMNNLEAAICGVYAHGLAGDIAAEELGQISLIATDIIDALPAAFSGIS